MLRLGFIGKNAEIPIPARRQLLEKWLAQALDSLALAERHGLPLASYQRDVQHLRDELAALGLPPASPNI